MSAPLSRTLAIASFFKGSVPTNTVAPSISGTIKTGNSVVVTPGTWTGSPSLTYTLLKGATAIVGPGASKATVEAYAFVAGDSYSPITLKESDSVSSTFATSNALVYLWTTPGVTLKGRYDGSHVTITSGRVSAVLDQSGNGNDLSQAGSTNRPTQSPGGGPNGLDAIDFAINGAIATGVLSTNIGLGVSTARTVVILGEAPAAGRYHCDGQAGNTMVLFNSSGNEALYAGVALSDGAITGGVNIVASGVFNGTSSKVTVNAGTTSTGNTGAVPSDVGFTWGGYASFSAAQCANCKMSIAVVYSGAMSDADALDLRYYMMGLGAL